MTSDNGAILERDNQRLKHAVVICKERIRDLEMVVRDAKARVEELEAALQSIAGECVTAIDEGPVPRSETVKFLFGVINKAGKALK